MNEEDKKLTTWRETIEVINTDKEIIKLIRWVQDETESKEEVKKNGQDWFGGKYDENWKDIYKRSKEENLSWKEFADHIESVVLEDMGDEKEIYRKKRDKELFDYDDVILASQTYVKTIVFMKKNEIIGSLKCTWLNFRENIDETGYFNKDVLKGFFLLGKIEKNIKDFMNAHSSFHHSVEFSYNMKKLNIRKMPYDQKNEYGEDVFVKINNIRYKI